MQTIGFIGLGIMGKPMAANLLGAGYPLIVYDIVPEAVAETVAKGAKAAKSPADVARQVDVVVTMLPNSPQVKTVVCGEDGVLSGAKPGLILVDMSSIAPLAAQEIAREAGKKGVVMLDCPVSGGQPKAVDGTLSIMAGGPEEVFEQVKPMLLCMGASAVLVGDVGSGNMTKLANQIIVAGNISAMSEAVVLASKAGIDAEKVFEAIRGGLAGSTVLDAKMPLILQRNFNPGFRIDLHVKDLGNVVETAQEVEAPIPLTQEVLEMMKHLQAEGKGGQDHGGLVQYYEEKAGVKVQK